MTPVATEFFLRCAILFVLGTVVGVALRDGLTTVVEVLVVAVAVGLIVRTMVPMPECLRLMAQDSHDDNQF